MTTLSYVYGIKTVLVKNQRSGNRFKTRSIFEIEHIKQNETQLDHKDLIALDQMK